MERESSFGRCSCGGMLYPVCFTEYEYQTIGGTMIRTGRSRRAVSHLICDECLKPQAVDDSLDGPWPY